MSIFGEHIDLIVELLDELVAKFGIEDFFDGNIKIKIFAKMYGAESTL